MSCPPARRRGFGALTRLHRSGAPVALFTFFCFALTFSPARIARAAPASPDTSNAQPSESAPATTDLSAGSQGTGADPGTASPSSTDSAQSVPDTQATASGDPNVPKQLPAQDHTAGDPSNNPKQQVDPNQGQASATPKVSSVGSGGTPSKVESLPSGADKSGVTSKAISTPKGSGKIDGMGESFSAQLSTGIATFSVPFALPKARGGAQPSLALSYSSSGGLGIAGMGWSLGVPFIARQTDRGVAKYLDVANPGQFDPDMDRFVFNGGQELVPICVVGGTPSCEGRIISGEQMPPWAQGWMYFRPRVEGSFLRFFWSPKGLTWRVQDKSGVTMEFGVVPLDAKDHAGAVETNPDNPAEIYRWQLARQYDTYGDFSVLNAPKPYNVVVYQYNTSFGDNTAYLSDIYDTTPAAAPSNYALAGFAHHTHLGYQARPDPTFSYRSGWRIGQTQRLRSVTVTSATSGGAAGAERKLVRRYWLSYDDRFHVSLLDRVQPEGRCSGDENSALGETTALAQTAASCGMLPPLDLGYTHVKPQPGELGYEAIDETGHEFTNSPDHSIDEGLTDLFDVNSDGLPDVVVTAPGLYGGDDGLYLNQGDSFSSALHMPVDTIDGIDSNVLQLDNSNVTPLDLNGDGTIDLVHMPMVKKYEIFTPLGSGTTWSWHGRSITTASQQSPKIDFTNDNPQIRVADVNFDGLVDIVVTTGTEMETFFSLGRYPGGDGQFGHAERMIDPTSAHIYNDPVTSCLPWSATPIQFDDPDVKLADMNGDGIVDIVRVRPGDVRYWPGRGNGYWGTGSSGGCPAGTYGQGIDIAMTNSPEYGVVQGDGRLLLDDVNGDGLADLVEVRFNAVDIYLNKDGTSWTPRHVIYNTWPATASTNRVRLVNVDGSGTRDIVWGDGYSYKYIDLEGGQQPWLLNHVDNGLGKTTDVTYESSVHAMLDAEKHGTCSQAQLADNPWNCAWTTKMPIVTQVVESVTQHDNLPVAGNSGGSYETDYYYRDPVYEGRQREFRGFTQA